MCYFIKLSPSLNGVLIASLNIFSPFKSKKSSRWSYENLLMFYLIFKNFYYHKSFIMLVSIFLYKFFFLI